MADRVAVLSPEGQFGTVDAADADAVTRAGGKVLTKAQVAERETEEKYQAQGLGTKVATVASMAGPIGYPIHAYLRSHGAVLPPELEAYQQGVSQGFTGGAASVGMKEIVGAVGGEKAAHAYGETAQQVSEAHAGLHTAGEIAGFLGGAAAGGPKAGLGSASKLIPGAAIGAIGNVVEQSAARTLAPIAARGAIGRAIATGGELAVRGGVEGALYGGANQITEDMLGDHEVAADKVFAAMGSGALYGGAGGALLGGAGSLAASGARSAIGAVGSARSGIGRALAKGSELTAEAAADGGAVAESGARKLVGEAADAVGVKPAAEVSDLRKMLSGDIDAGARGAANTMAFDALGTTRKVADRINKEVEGGTKAVGDYVNRRILKVGDEGTSLVGTVASGRADKLLPLIEADKATIGAGIGEIVKAAPVRIAENDLLEKAGTIFRDMASDPTRIQGAKPFQEQVAQSLQALKNGGQLGTDGTINLSDMYYARAKMEGVAFEMKRSNSAAGDAMKDWLRDVDSHLVDKIDEAARTIGNEGQKEKLLGLKREYQLASSAEKAASDGANRIAGNNSFGIREGIGAMAGLATGHPLAAIGAAVGGKLLRERGSAAGAYLLTKMADMWTLARAVKAVDDQIGRASAGILAAPKKGPLPLEAPAGTVHARAEAAARRTAEMQAEPGRIADRATAAAEPYQNAAPKLAGALTQRLTSAAAFMASKMPTAPDPDPFDPHPAPRFTDAQAAEYAQYDWYCEKPSRFFDEAAHGKLTFEGVEVARALMAGAFQELQQRTISGLAEMMAQKKPPPYVARQRMGIMLGIPAVPEQRPDHMGFLQANVIGSEKAQQAPIGAQSPPKRPLSSKTQSSTLDRLEGK